MRYVDSTLGLESGDRLSGWLSQELTTASALTLRTGFFSARAIGLVQDALEGLLGAGRAARGRGRRAASVRHRRATAATGSLSAIPRACPGVRHDRTGVPERQDLPRAASGRPDQRVGGIAQLHARRIQQQHGGRHRPELRGRRPHRHRSGLRSHRRGLDPDRGIRADPGDPAPTRTASPGCPTPADRLGSGTAIPAARRPLPHAAGPPGPGDGRHIRRSIPCCAAGAAHRIRRPGCRIGRRSAARHGDSHRVPAWSRSQHLRTEPAHPRRLSSSAQPRACTPSSTATTRPSCG